MYVQLQIKVDRNNSVKIQGNAPSCNITPTGTAATGTLPPEVFDVVSDLRQGDLNRDRLTLSVACGRWTGVP